MASGLGSYRQFDAWKLAEAFKQEVYRIVLASPAACADLRYRGQTLDASGRPSANFAEGFLRSSPGDFARFLDYGVGSIGETERRLHDGIRLRYFSAADCAAAFRLGRRTAPALINLKKAQLRYAAQMKKSKRNRKGVWLGA